jgi:hypothetical protein
VDPAPEPVEFAWNEIEQTNDPREQAQEKIQELVMFLDPDGRTRGACVRNRALAVMFRYSKRYQRLGQDQFLERYGLHNSRSIARAFESFQRTFGVNTKNVPRGTKTKTRPAGRQGLA